MTTEKENAPLRMFARESARCFREVKAGDEGKGFAYLRIERSLWFTLDPYSIRSGILDNDAVELRRLSVASALHNLAVAEDRETPPNDVSRPVTEAERFDVSLSAPLKIEAKRELGFITEDGLRPFSGELQLEVHIGPGECSSIKHYKSDDYDPSEVTFFSVWIDRARMEWLHRELLARPNAVLRMLVKPELFQHQVDQMAAEPGHYQQFYIEPELATPIKGATFYVTDRERSEPAVPETEREARKMPLQSRVPVPTGDTSDFNKRLLKAAHWIIAMLVLIAAVLLFKR